MMNVFSGRPAWAAYFVLPLCILISSCEKPEDSLGLGLVPEESLLGLSTYTDSDLLKTYVVASDSARTNELSRTLLGELYLPDFGTSNAILYTQVLLSALSVDFSGGEDTALVALDSLVLSLEFLEMDSLYGEEQALFFTVEQLEEALDLDSLYYSNYGAQTQGGNLILPGKEIITPAPADSVDLYGLNYPPQLRLRLNEDIGNALINESLADASSFDDASEFVEYIKGFKVSAFRVNSGDRGAILGLDLLSIQSRLTLYYHNAVEDSLSFNFAINENGQRYLEFEQVYGPSIQSLLDDQSTDDEQLYLSSMAGVNIQVELPTLIGLTDTLQGAFNKVELVLPVSDLTMDDELFPDRLFAVYETDEGDVLSIPDIFEGELHSDGKYDADNGEYRVNITRYAQQVVTGVIEQSVPSIRLLPVSNSITANSVALNGKMDVPGGAKLVVTYTQYE